MAPKKDTAKKEIASKQGDLREEKMKALESALAQLNKTYGKGAVMKFGDAAADANLQVIPTGCLELDMALGVGGLPRGRVVEIYGPESSGKTTVALHCVAEAQKMGGVCAFIDAEHALDPVYARKLGDNTAMQVDAISTGSLGLDLALGVGGVPRGRIIEVFGPESSGKTTLALHILAEAQTKGGEVAFIDVEHALDPAYASALGVNIDELLVSQPDTGEQAMEICEALVRSGAIDAIVVDSVAAMVPRAEIEGEMGDSHVGLQARLMSQAMRKLTSVIGKTNTVCVFINQLREKVGIVYGNPEVTTGGRALKYYSSVRIDIRRVEGLKDSSGQFIGNHTRAKIVKNKVAPPFREAEFDIMFGEGISKMSELIDVGVKLGIVQKSGAWFNYGDIRLGQGRDNAKQFLKDNPEIANDIEGQIRANADKLYATRRPAGKAAAAAAEKEEGGETASASKEPVVKAPARSSESELDIMVED